MKFFGLEKGFKRNKKTESPLEEAALSVRDIEKELADFDRLVDAQSESLPFNNEATLAKLEEVNKLIKNFEERIQIPAQEWRTSHKYEDLPADLQALVSDFYKLREKWRQRELTVQEDLKKMRQAGLSIKYESDLSGTKTKKEELDRELEAYADTHSRAVEHEPTFSPDFENKTFAFLKKSLPENMIHISNIVGFDSPKAWEIRKEAKKDSLLENLAGLESEKAWEIRRGFFEDRLNMPGLLESLIGLDGEEAWLIREYFLTHHIDRDRNWQYVYLLRSLAGLNDARAWDMRKKITNNFQDMRLFESGSGLSDGYGAMIFSLVGIDSDEAWKLRLAIFSSSSKDANLMTFSFPNGLIGLNSPEAQEFRKKLEPGAFLRSLALIEDDWAWEEREEALRNGAFLNAVEASLMGLNSPRAWEFRTRLIKKIKKIKEFYPEYLMASFSNQTLVAIKKAQKREGETLGVK